MAEPSSKGAGIEPAVNAQCSSSKSELNPEDVKLQHKSDSNPENGNQKEQTGLLGSEMKSEIETESDSNPENENQEEQRSLLGNEGKTTVNTEGKAQLWFLRIAKYTAIAFVVVCAWLGIIINKVTLVSITGRMYSLSNSTESGVADEKTGSMLYVQLVAIMIIPEFVSFFRCLIWGVIGKTTKTFPWPNWKLILLEFARSCVEVAALCLFVFGVACKIPPELTIVLLNGCFCFPTGRYLIHKLRRSNYIKKCLPLCCQEGKPETIAKPKSCVWVLSVLETLAFFIQLTMLIIIPVLLVTIDENEISLVVPVLIPISLFLLSLVWSGWITEWFQKITNTITSNENDENLNNDSEKVKHTDRRLKPGLITSAMRIVLILFSSYGFAVWLLDFEINLDVNNFEFDNHELGIFMANIFMSFIAYLFAWITCALQSFSFFLSVLPCTPVAFGWFACTVQLNEAFPFVKDYSFDWDIALIIPSVAFLFWVSQFMAFGCHIMQNSKVLTNDADLFWMPRYNSIFVEQHLIINRKTAITGDINSKSIIVKSPGDKTRDCTVFICSTMFHENVAEMSQLLRSINRIALAPEDSDRQYIFESHIFFDNACTGSQLNQWIIQLLGLLSSTVSLEPNEVEKMETPYGMQLKYARVNNKNAERDIPFHIHLKDNNKVKNKKRWSQVMYMKYVLKHRTDIDSNKSFILTTDADVDFTYDSVVALLDILDRDYKVGAVCARTYPLGSGPLVWYQTFDYTVGHWFQKAAEHILGCVLCCPGCFSAFRGSALKKVMEEYATTVENGFDFLIKDMGEDRWLCTLLIQNGYRLEYSAVSQDSTYCPETFEEFYKQRRRWIASTIANMAKVIRNYHSITTNNDSISILFILYQVIMFFSTLISPATVILVIVTGLKSIDSSLSEEALLVALSVISVLYGVVCIYATEKTQINIAMILTLLFSIIMAIVISGILTETIDVATKGDQSVYTNSTSSHFRFPVDVSVVYLGIFAVTFIIAGIFHANEIFGLLHSIWYLLCLPSGYLFLMIYAFCNINNRSWGTREGATIASNKSQSWLEYYLDLWYKLVTFIKTNLCFQLSENPSTDEPYSLPFSRKVHIEDDLHPFNELSGEVKTWLQNNKCKDYMENFQNEGYTELDFIATMKMEDLKAIGIQERGFLLKLEKAVKTLPTPELNSNVPQNVEEWLRNLKLEQYTNLFESKGYSDDVDVENLKGLNKDDLQEMGITRRAHINQLLTHLKYLQYPSEVDIRNNKTRSDMDKIPTKRLQSDDETKFWTSLVKDYLKPESTNLSKVKELKEKLTNLRNYSVMVLLLTNVMWIVFLYALAFPQLTKYNLPHRAFSLLFLAVFSIIIIIQFIAMIFHRFANLLHLLAAVRVKIQVKQEKQDKRRQNKATVDKRCCFKCC